MKKNPVVIEKIRNYLIARYELLQFAEIDKSLAGNDNIIGSRIGEFIAMEYYKMKEIITRKETSAVNPGFDLTYHLGRKERKVSVKLISGENKLKMTTPLKKTGMISF